MPTNSVLGPKQSGIATDPDLFYHGLGIFNILPNPDPILRKLGKSQKIYEDIMVDSHVSGELQAIRGLILRLEFDVQPGGNRRSDKLAANLCRELFSQIKLSGNKLIPKLLPKEIMNLPSSKSERLPWYDLIYQMGIESILFGHRVHEILWQRRGAYIIPVNIVDVPNRRLVFGFDGQPRIRTIASPTEGEDFKPMSYLVTNHLATTDNPHGVAVLSSCYWPVLFKKAGFASFTKFVERFGNPWPLGKYPQGTSVDEQEQLLEQLTEMIDAGCAVISNDKSVEFLEPKATGDVHQILIDLCNRELSKALTSQTLATEIQGQGSRAAAETHQGRTEKVTEAIQKIVADRLNLLFSWITEINFPDAESPIFMFYEEQKPNLEWVEFFEKTRKFLDIPKLFAYERLGIPVPSPSEEILPGEGELVRNQPLLGAASIGKNMSFAARQPSTNLDELVQTAAAQATKNVFIPTLQEVDMILKQASSLEEAQAFIADLKLSEFEKLIPLLEQGYTLATLMGMDEAQLEAEKKTLKFADSTSLGVAASNVSMDLPFTEAINFLKKKTAVTDEEWDELANDSKTLAFHVTGVTQKALITDLQQAVVKALEQGSTIKDFRQDFEQIAAKHGWNYGGNTGWRTQVIFDTNLTVARAAGKWQQFQQTKDSRPFLQYTAIRDHRTRPDHAMLDGTIRQIDSDFWAHYYPPIGFRCRCTVISLDGEQMSRHGFKETPPNAVWTMQEPNGKTRQVREGDTYDWMDKKTGKIEKLPIGVQPGFNFPPGKYLESLGLK